MVQRTTKFTGICIAIYVVYALFVFLILPMLLPDVISLSRYELSRETQHLGNLTSFKLETGGEPRRTLLVTFRGSGAISLLYELSREPGCYHHFSPLIAYKRRVRTSRGIKDALNEIVSLYNCNYNQSMAMLSHGSATSTFRDFYGVQWKTCLTYSEEVCWNPETVSKICRMHPFINMSVYNMGLRYLATLLTKVELNLRILLLVRDPRGTMTSRAHRVWCQGFSECSEPDDLCTNMVDDYEIAQKLITEYPNRFGVVRYEEIAAMPIDGLKTVFKFYNLPLPFEDVKPSSIMLKNEAQEHTKPYFERPMDWISLLDKNEIVKIQNTCEKAMQLWGYRPITNPNDIKDYNPLEKRALYMKFSSNTTA